MRGPRFDGQVRGLQARKPFKTLGVELRGSRRNGADLWQDGQPRQFGHMDPWCL